ncbi:uncharacterized protein TNCV_825331 [Trichonephila clavipes]|nr:uncharacterized protein TNCV_825331 [Trichonephila clavipes]
MRVWKQWTNEHRTTRKTGSVRRKVTSACDNRHLLHMAVNDRTFFSSSWQYVVLLLQVYKCRLRQFVNVCCTVDCVQWCLYTGFPSRQTIDGCACNVLMSTEPDKLIGFTDESSFNL